MIAPEARVCEGKIFVFVSESILVVIVSRVTPLSFAFYFYLFALAFKAQRSPSGRMLAEGRVWVKKKTLTHCRYRHLRC